MKNILYLLLVGQLFLMEHVRSQCSSCSGGGAGVNATGGSSSPENNNCPATEVSYSGTPGASGNGPTDNPLQPTEIPADSNQGGAGGQKLMPPPLGDPPVTQTPGPAIPVTSGGGLGQTWMPQASSPDVSHPITYAFKDTPGSESEIVTINPPAGYYTVYVDPQDGSDIVSNTIVNPIQPSGSLSFKVKFYPLQEEPLRSLGESLGLEVTRPESRIDSGNSTLMFPSVEFTAHLNTDQRTTAGTKPGRCYGKIIGTNLLQGVGGHRFRFKTAHSPVSTPANPTTDIVEATGTDTYQIRLPNRSFT